MNCPDCNLYMDLITMNGFDVNWCFKCEGIWLRHKTLIEILSNSDQSSNILLEELEKENNNYINRHCPECKEENLLEYNINNILIDKCAKCSGIYVDKGELTKLAPNAKKDSIDDLNYQEHPYLITDYFNVDIDTDNKIEQNRKVIGPWQSIIVFLLFIIILVLQLDKP